MTLALFLTLYGAVSFGAGLALGAWIHAGNPSRETPVLPQPAIDEPDAYPERTDLWA